MAGKPPVTTRWSRRAARELGGVGSSLWPKINAIGQREDVVNLGQGFPDFAAPAAAHIGAQAAMTEPRSNQYAPVGGLPRLRKCVSELSARLFPDARVPDADTEVAVMSSGTEAIYAAMQALLDDGDEVIVFEPAFPWYFPCIRLAGGVPVPVELQAPSFAVPAVDQLRRHVTPKTKMVLFNTPHNPTGHVAGADELDAVAQLCREHDLLCLADEVYEACAFPASGRTHQRIRDREGMWDRTLTMGGASKLLSLTGWRVGWLSGHSDLVAGCRLVQSYMTYSAPTPLQHGCAAAIEAALAPGGDLTFGGLGARFEANWGALASALRSQGVEVCEAEGGYFLVADVRSTGLTDWDYCLELAERRKVAAVPMSMFYVSRDGDEQPKRTLVRFAICKEQPVIAEAAARLKAPWKSSA